MCLVSFPFPHCLYCVGVVMGYRRDSVEIFQGEMKKYRFITVIACKIRDPEKCEM